MRSSGRHGQLSHTALVLFRRIIITIAITIIIHILLAAGGLGVGTTWTAIAGREDELVQDTQSVVATKERLAQL